MTLLDELQDKGLLQEVILNLPKGVVPNITITKKALTFSSKNPENVLQDCAILLGAIDDTAEDMHGSALESLKVDVNHPTGDLIDGIVYFYFNIKK